MIRKLISMGLCSVGVLSLLGAGVAQAEETSNQTAGNSDYVVATLGTDFSQVAKVPELVESLQAVESTLGVENHLTAIPEGMVLGEFGLEEVVVPEVEEIIEEVVEELPEEVAGDPYFMINGVPVSYDVNRQVINGVTYVNLLAMAKELDETANGSWSGSRAFIQTSQMQVEATVGQLYMIANGRYLYIEEGVQNAGDDVRVPLNAVLRAFDATEYYYQDTGIMNITTRSGAITNGAYFYNTEDLFWLSRVIFAEANTEPLEGQMGVAIVVYNRIADSWYPDTVQGVLAQKNQFSTYKNGALADRTPTETNIIAAKLVMDGGIVRELRYATHFDSISGSWAERNLTTIARIGGHTFYA